MLIQHRADFLDHMLYLCITFRLTFLYQLGNLKILLTLQIFKAQVFQFILNFTDTKAVCDRRIYFQSFTGNLLLFCLTHVLQCPHIVKPIGKLDQNDTHILGHGNENLTVVAGQILLLVLEFQSTNLSNRLNQRCDLITEQTRDILRFNIAIFYGIMQKSCSNRFGTCSQ